MPKRGIQVSALYGALDSKRVAQRISWRQLAKELELSPSVFTRLAQGKRPEFDSFLQMTDWLGVSMESFIGGRQQSEKEAEETVAVISAYLRADKALKPDSAEAIERIVRAAYDQMAEP